MGSSWKDIVAGVAPALATALGGPGIGAAVRALSQKFLGHPNGTEAEVAAAVVGATPEQIESLRKLDHEFTLSLVDKAVALEQIEAGDRANARAREVDTKDLTTRVLAYATVAAFFALLYVMFARAIPEANRSAFDILLGVLAGAMTQVLGYYFGSSNGSKAKDAVIGQIAANK